MVSMMELGQPVRAPGSNALLIHLLISALYIVCLFCSPLTFFVLSHHTVVGWDTLFTFVFVLMVMDLLSAEKDSDMKLRVLVRLQSGMSFSHFGELWPRGDSPRSLYTNLTWKKSHLGKICGEAWWAVGIGRHMAGYASCYKNTCSLLIYPTIR